MVRPSRLAIVAILLAAPTLKAQSAAPRDSLAFARQVAEWFYTSQVDSLWAHTGAEVQKKLEKPEKYMEFLGELTGRAGAEEKLMEEKFVKRSGNTQYWRTSKYALADEPLMLRFAFSKDFQIIGVGMNPASEAPPVDPIK